MSFKTTTFRFVSGDFNELTLDSIMVYTIHDDWHRLSEGDPKCDENPGIGNPTILNNTFGVERNCIVTLEIDAELVNNINKASDNASLLFSVNGSNFHIDIRDNETMAYTGTYGSEPKAVDWEWDPGNIGGQTNFTCTKNT